MKCDNNYCLIITIILLTASLSTPAFCRSQRSIAEKALVDLLDTLGEKAEYNSRVRPGSGGPPVQVKVSAYIVNVQHGCAEKREWRLDVFLRQQWQDTRLSHIGIRPIITGGTQLYDKIWIPDTVFSNDKESYFNLASAPQSYLSLGRNGDITHSVRFRVKAKCQLHLQDYPFDFQSCQLVIESYSATAQDIVYVWAKGETSAAVLDVLINETLAKEFEVGTANVGSKFHVTNTGNFSKLYMEVEFFRKAWIFIPQIYLPTILLVCSTWLTFYVTPRQTLIRLIMTALPTVTILLVMLTHVVRPVNVETNYLKASDVFHMWSALFGFLAIVECSFIACCRQSKPKKRKKKASSYSAKKAIEDTDEDDEDLGEDDDDSNHNHRLNPSRSVGQRLDFYCRYLFPILYLTFMVLYFGIYGIPYIQKVIQSWH